jgi:hypothetical protein
MPRAATYRQSSYSFEISSPVWSGMKAFSFGLRGTPGLSLPGEFFLRGLSREAARIARVIELAASDQICETAAKEVDMDKTSGIQSMALSRRTIV